MRRSSIEARISGYTGSAVDLLVCLYYLSEAFWPLKLPRTKEVVFEAFGTSKRTYLPAASSEMR